MSLADILEFEDRPFTAGQPHIDQQSLVGAQAAACLVDNVAHELIPLHQSIAHHFLVVSANVTLHLQSQQKKRGSVGSMAMVFMQPAAGLSP